MSSCRTCASPLTRGASYCSRCGSSAAGGKPRLHVDDLLANCNQCGKERRYGELTRCSVGHERVCEDCGKKCVECERFACPACTADCFGCKKTGCADCFDHCETCHAAAMCADCGADCAECQYATCDDCTKECRDCGDSFCKGCFEEHGSSKTKRR